MVEGFIKLGYKDRLTRLSLTSLPVIMDLLRWLVMLKLEYSTAHVANEITCSLFDCNQSYVCKEVVFVVEDVNAAFSVSFSVV